ncbi:MAG: DUF4185 domain-containing protein [Deltaproteobacteria bacterium]|nr:DUF4185 domain-containing protein [Deltaproteobacteria bacterium]
MESHQRKTMTAFMHRSRKRSGRLGVSWAIVALFCLLPFFFAGCHPASGRTAGCLPNFPDRDGWYGADGAYSILLGDGRTLWLFGDTFVSDRAGKQDRVGMDVVLGTTLAISTCNSEGQFDIHYFLKKSAGRFISAFGDGQWMWPQDPFTVHDRLYIPLAVIEPAPDEAGPFKFRVAGHKIAVIQNYRSRDPDGWSVEYLDWSAAVPPGVAALAATSVVHGDAVYFYPFCVPTREAPEAWGNLLVRVPIDRLHDPAGAMEYYAKDHTWQRGFDPAEAAIVLDAGVSELSVRYHESRKQWIAVYLSPQNRGDRLLYRSAERLEGPWSDAKVLLAPVPEVTPADPKYDSGNFCYAGKEHIQFARDGKLVATYVCNSLEEMAERVNFIRTHLFLYRPVVNVAPY